MQKARRNRALDSHYNPNATTPNQATPNATLCQATHPLPAIVAGSAPSLKAIDYSRLPLEFEVFRVNQFYFEDRYYLGRRIKATTTATTYTTFAQVYTTLNLLTHSEYEIGKVFLQDNHIWFGRDKNGEQNLQALNLKQTLDTLSHYSRLNGVNPHKTLIDVAYNGSFSHNIAEFLEWSNLASIYYGHHITTGILACALAVAMGHREIYIAGIDFYSGETHYFTNMRTPNIAKHTDLFGQEACDESGNYKSGMQWHKKAADIEGLYFLQEAYGVKFYSLCESSPISELIPLAKVTNNTFSPEPKPKDYICDFCIPPQESYDFAQVQQVPQMQQMQQIRPLKQNIYFRLLWDLSRIPKHIKLYIKGKIAKEKYKKQMREDATK